MAAWKRQEVAKAAFGFQELLWANSESIAIDPGRNTSRNSQLAFPLSQFSTIYGQHALLRVVLDAHYRVGPHNGEAVQYQDVLSYLKEELSGAYELLERQENAQLWQSCSPMLALAIRNHDGVQLNVLRTAFFSQLGPADHTTTGVFAWAIIVEAALLNERLIADMREVASSHGCDCLTGDGMAFYEPRPTPEAAETFNQYVRCRWPIHVFHVDPVNQEQNVGDRFSSRRELQLALAVAVATGTTNVSTAAKYARKMELEMDSINLNRTVIGFSHGEDTFGFRFQPRVQSPDTPRMGKAVHQMFHGVSKDSILDDHRIEPGQRECLALVVAPSFLRQLIVDVHSDWYPLTNPKKTRMTTTKAVDLSADIRAMQDSAQVCVKDAGKYRDGEVYRLLRRVDQLSKELPMQTLRVEIPVARQIGGFRLLANGGNFDRSPQLYGYYGEPGVNVNRNTTLFLLGENFRLQGMRVVAGGKPIENLEAVTISGKETPAQTNLRIISDTVLEVTIPEGVDILEDETVDVHVATYNGPSQHIRIPSISTKKAAAKEIDEKIAEHVAIKHINQYAWSAEDDTILVQLVLDGKRQVIDAIPQSDVSISASEGSPFAGTSPAATFRGWIFEKRANEDVAKKPIQNATAKMDLLFVRGEVNVKEVTNQGMTYSPLGQALQMGLAGYSVPPDLESIEIQGFLKFKDEQGDIDGQPVIRMENRLKLKISLAVCGPVCPEDNACPPPVAPTVAPAPPAEPQASLSTSGSGAVTAARPSFRVKRHSLPTGGNAPLLIQATRPSLTVAE